MKNLRIKWIMTYSRSERKLRILSLMFEKGKLSYKINFSVFGIIPRITLHKGGGVYV
jgi:hypothetical protein